LFVYWTGYSLEFGTDQKLYFRIYNGTQLDTPKSSVATIGQWTHVVGVYSTTIGPSLYVNGSYVGNTPTSGVLSYLSFSASYVGRWSTSYFNGLIDDVRIYAEALPSTEIQKHYVQGLEKLLFSQAIPQAEYDQRISVSNQYLAFD
jgi:hypothetical protein